jgi:hypothetical protein
LTFFSGRLRAGLPVAAKMAGIASGLGAIAGYLVFGVLADTWGRKPAIWV